MENLKVPEVDWDEYADDWPTDPEVREVAELAAEQIVAALNALPGPVRGELLWSLLDDPSTCLSGMASTMRAKNPVRPLAAMLVFDTWCGDALEVAERLSDSVEPWKTIRESIFNIRTALLDAGWRVWFEWRRMGREKYSEAHPDDRTVVNGVA